MACKIAEASLTFKTIEWPSDPSSVVAEKPLSKGVASHSDKASLKEQEFAEYEKLRQAELSHCRQAALAEGLKKGREEAAAEVKNASDRLAQTLRELSTLKQRIRSGAEADVVKLSLAIARRILHRELSIDPESIAGVVHAALQKLGNREIVTIRTSAAALDIVKSALTRAGISTGVSVVPDPKMREGDLVFETKLGDLDASVDTQLQEIGRGFADRLGLA